MARGTALSTIRTLLKAELRDAQETNTSTDTEYNHAISSKQKDLCLAFDWPFLEHKWDAPAAIGSRYLDFPTTDIRALACTINFERPVEVSRLYNTKYELLDYGVGVAEYNWRNSDLDERIDPIQRWQLVTNTSESANPDEFEIWPIPVTAQTIRFVGQRNPLTLSADADKADLDDLLLVYFVAADYLLLRNQPNAPLQIKKANDHLVKLRAGYPTNNEDAPITIGGKSPMTREQVRLTSLVLIAP